MSSSLPPEPPRRGLPHGGQVRCHPSQRASSARLATVQRGGALDARPVVNEWGAVASSPRQSLFPSSTARSKPNTILLGRGFDHGVSAGALANNNNINDTDHSRARVTAEFVPLPALTAGRDVGLMAQAYFDNREEEAMERRSNFQRQTRMMLLGRGNEHLDRPDNVGGSQDSATLIVVGSTGAQDAPYLTMNEHQQRILLQTTFRSQHGLGSHDPRSGIQIPVASATPPEDPFARMESTAQELPACLPPLFRAQDASVDITTIATNVRGHFDDGGGLGTYPTGFLNPDRLTFLNKRAETLMITEQRAQQIRQQDALVALEAEQRPCVPQQAERERMVVIASWLKQFPTGHQLEMLALQQHFFPSALSKTSVAQERSPAKRAVVVHVPEGGGMRVTRRSPRRPRHRHSTDPESNDQSSLPRRGTHASVRRRSSATLADIDSFFASIANDDCDPPSLSGRGRRSRSGRSHQLGARPKGGDQGVAPNGCHQASLGPPLPSAPCSAEPAELVAISLARRRDKPAAKDVSVQGGQAAIGKQVKEALHRVGIVYGGFTTSHLYAHEGQCGSTRTEGGSDSHAHEGGQLVQFAALDQSERMLSTFTARPSEASEDGVRSIGSHSSPSLKSNIDSGGASVSPQKGPEADDNLEEDTESASASGSARSRSHSRAASIASAFGGAVKDDDAEEGVADTSAAKEDPAQDVRPSAGEDLSKAPLIAEKTVPAQVTGLPQKKELPKPPKTTVGSQSINIRKNPQIMAAANAAAKRLSDGVHEAIQGIVLAELQSRLMCNWFGSPSQQALDAFGVGSTPGGSITLLDLPQPTGKPACGGHPSSPLSLLSHRLLPRLGCGVGVSDRPLDNIVEPSSFLSSPPPMLQPPANLNDVASAAADGFAFFYEQTMPWLIGHQLSFATEACASHLDFFDEGGMLRSVSTSAAHRPKRMKEALVKAIDAYRVADEGATFAQQQMRSTGLRRAQLASQAASASAAKVSVTVTKMLEAVLPSFLRPEQQECHMLLLADGARPTRVSPRGKHAKVSTMLRPNPSITRGDLFYSNLLEDFTTLRSNLLAHEISQRPALLASGGERIGLALRQAGQSLPTEVTPQRPLLQSLQNWCVVNRAASSQYPIMSCIADLCSFQFEATSDSDTATLPLLLPGVPPFLWETSHAMLGPFTDRVETALNGFVSSYLGNPRPSVSDEQNTEADAHITFDGKALGLILSRSREEILRLEVLLKGCLHSMPLRLIVAIREEMDCRCSLRRLADLCEEVIVRRYEAAGASVKRMLWIDPTMEPPHSSVALGYNAVINANTAIPDGILTCAAADLFYSASIRPRLRQLHVTATSLHPIIPRVPISLLPQELTRSSFVHFIQLFNSYAPQSNAWARQSAFAPHELRVLRLALAKAHVSTLLCPPPTTPSSSLLGLLPYNVSSLSTVGPTILSALFAADEASLELVSVQKRMASLQARRADCRARADALGEALSAINFQIMLSHQSMPSSSVAAAAARRMSVVHPTDDVRDGLRNSFSNPHAAAYERQLEVEVERRKVLDEAAVIETQLRGLVDEKDKALNALCRAQATSLFASCIDAAASSMCTALSSPCGYIVCDVTEALLDGDSSESNARALSLSKAMQSGRRLASSGHSVAPEAKLRLPANLQLTCSMSGVAPSRGVQFHDGLLSGEERPNGDRIMLLSPRSWSAPDFILPYCRSYCSGEVTSFKPSRSQAAEPFHAVRPAGDGMRGIDSRRLRQELASWLTDVDTNKEGALPLEGRSESLLAEGLFNGAVVAAVQQHRAVSSREGEDGFVLTDGCASVGDGWASTLRLTEEEVIALHCPQLPMVALLPSINERAGGAPQRGVRPNFLFAWRVSGMVLRFVACKLLPIVRRVREHRASVALQPAAAFVIQCAFRRCLQRRRIRARAAVRRIERFLYGKIQVILARKARAFAVLRRAMRLWHMARLTRVRVEMSLILMRDEVIRRRMQCMHARRVLVQLRRLQEERTVLTHKCTLQAHRILSDERMAWRSLCELVRVEFFEGLAVLLAGQAERECLRAIVGAGGPPPGGFLIPRAHGDDLSEEGSQPADGGDDLSPFLPPENERRNSSTAFAFFREYGRRLSVGDNGLEASTANSDASPQRLPTRRGSTSGRRSSRGRLSQVALDTMVDALSPQHRRSIIGLLGTSAGGLQVDTIPCVAVAESSIAAWRRSRTGSIFAPDAPRRTCALPNEEGLRDAAMHSSSSPRADDVVPPAYLNTAAMKLLRGHSRLPRFSVVDAGIWGGDGSGEDSRHELQRRSNSNALSYAAPRHILAGPIVLHHYEPTCLHEFTDTAEYVRSIFIPRSNTAPQRASIPAAEARRSRAIDGAMVDLPPLAEPVPARLPCDIVTRTQSRRLGLMHNAAMAMSLDSMSVARNLMYPSQQPIGGSIAGETDMTSVTLREFLRYPEVSVAEDPPPVSQLPQRPNAGEASGDHIPKDIPRERRGRLLGVSSVAPRITGRKRHVWCRAESYVWLHRAPVRGWDVAARPYSTPTTAIGRFWLCMCTDHRVSRGGVHQQVDFNLRYRLLSFVLDQHPHIFFPLSTPSVPLAGCDLSLLVASAAVSLSEDPIATERESLSIPPASRVSPRTTTAARFRAKSIAQGPHPSNGFPFLDVQRGSDFIFTGLYSTEDCMVQSQSRGVPGVSFSDARAGLSELLAPQLSRWGDLASTEAIVGNLYRMMAVACLTELKSSTDGRQIGSQIVSMLSSVLTENRSTFPRIDSDVSHLRSIMQLLGPAARTLVVAFVGSAMYHGAHADPEGPVAPVMLLAAKELLGTGSRQSEVPFVYDIYSTAGSDTDSDEPVRVRLEDRGCSQLQLVFPDGYRLRNTVLAPGQRSDTSSVRSFSFDFVPLSQCTAHVAMSWLRRDLGRLAGTNFQSTHKNIRRLRSRRRSLQMALHAKEGIVAEFGGAVDGEDDPSAMVQAISSTDHDATEEVTVEFIRLLETTERLERRQLQVDFRRVLDGIYEHVKWHMAVLYLVENTLVEIVDGVRGPRMAPIGVSGLSFDAGPHYLGRATASPRGRYDGFSRMLITRTLTGVHPIFASGSVLPSLRPMWVLQKGFTLLQDEYAHRCAIILEYEQTPLMALNARGLHSASGPQAVASLVAEAEYRANSRFADSAAVLGSSGVSKLEPRRPSGTPGGLGAFRGRATSILVSPAGERRVSLAGEQQAIPSRRNTVVGDLKTLRRQSVAVSTCSSNSRPQVSPERLHRAGVSSQRPYIDSPVRRGGSFASSSPPQMSEVSDGDPFEGFGERGVNTPRLSLGTLEEGSSRRRSTLKERNDEYQRRLSLMTDVGMPENRRGTLQYTDTADELARPAGGLLRRETTAKRVGKRATILPRIDASEDTPEGTPFALAARFSVSGGHHPFASLLQKQVVGSVLAGGDGEELGLKGGDASDSGASTPASQQSRNQSLHQCGELGGRIGSVNGLQFSPMATHHQPLASGGAGAGPMAFYAPASSNVHIPSTRSRRMTTAEAGILFPVSLPCDEALPSQPHGPRQAVAAQPLSILKTSKEDRRSPPRKGSEQLQTPRSSGIASVVSQRFSGSSTGTPRTSNHRGSSSSPLRTHVPKVFTPGSREALHEQLKAFRFRQSLAGPLEQQEATPLCPDGDELEGRLPSLDYSNRFSSGSAANFTNRGSGTNASPTSSARLSLEDEQQTGLVARSGNPYETNRDSATNGKRRITITRPSGTL